MKILSKELKRVLDKVNARIPLTNEERQMKIPPGALDEYIEAIPEQQKRINSLNIEILKLKQDKLMAGIASNFAMGSLEFYKTDNDKQRRKLSREGPRKRISKHEIIFNEFLKKISSDLTNETLKSFLDKYQIELEKLGLGRTTIEKYFLKNKRLLNTKF